jgi:hypothetical protein
MTRNEFILEYMLKRALYDCKTSETDLDAAIHVANTIEKRDKTIFSKS